MASPSETASRTDRTYGQYCPIAVGLDLLGDRWTLLICRELNIGDRRFTDLRKALPGIAPNLLSDRLRALTSAGLVESVELPAPAARSVYRLTDEGRSVRPVLRAMAHFGTAYLEPEDAGRYSALRAAHALLSAWRRRSDVDLRVRLVLTGSSSDVAPEPAADAPDTDAVDLVLTPGDTRVEPTEGTADVTITTTASALVRARQGERFVATVEGPAAKRRAALESFALELA